MNQHRRDFIKASGLVTSGLVLGSAPSAARAVGRLALQGVQAHEFKRLKNFGLQLWSVKDVMATDPMGTLKQVSTFGYKQIEGFEGDKGMFWGMSNTDFGKATTDLGMTFVSCHVDIDNSKGQFEKKAAQAGAIGMAYLICPWLGKQDNLDGYKKAADSFNSCGAICKKHGLRFGYHNHWYSFQVQDGTMPQDILMGQTDPALVDFEMDIYWVISAGADPVAWLQKYPGRFTLCHIKDRLKNADPKEFDASCDLGTGSIDFQKIVKIAAKSGMQYYIVEQEKFTGPSLKAASVDAAYMKNLEV